MTKLLYDKVLRLPLIQNNLVIFRLNYYFLNSELLEILTPPLYFPSRLCNTEVMETQRCYYDFFSPEAFKAEIWEIRSVKDGIAVILDKTIFYPEGGGQPGDRGTINGAALTDVREQGAEILHLLSPENGGSLVPGPAELVLDCRRRRDFTVHHTAQHLLSGTMLRLTGKPTVSMRLGDEVCTIDVDTPELSGETLVAVEEAAAGTIEGDDPVIIHLCPPENVKDFPLRKVPPQGEEIIRVVEIRGNDFSPCCGTHLQSTGQIGILRILGAEKYKGMMRVSFIAGRRVLRDSRLLRNNGDLISRSLKIPVTETGKGVLALLEKTAQLERKVKALEEEAAQIKAEALIRKAGLLAADTQAPPAAQASVSGAVFPEKGPTLKGEGVLLVESFPEAGIEELLQIGRAAQKLSAAAIILVSEKDKKFAAFCSFKGTDLRILVKEIMEAQGGRGGGGPSFFQGLFPSEEALAAFIAGLSKGACRS
jgi:alanyl-tRNA synthetase